jgi:hypothetical protein
LAFRKALIVMFVVRFWDGCSVAESLLGVRDASAEDSSNEKLSWKQSLREGGRCNSLILRHPGMTLVSDRYFDSIEEVCKVFGSITLVRLLNSKSDFHCDR